MTYDHVSICQEKEFAVLTMRRPERRKAKETTSMSVMTETAARLGLKDADLFALQFQP